MKKMLVCLLLAGVVAACSVGGPCDGPDQCGVFCKSDANCNFADKPYCVHSQCQATPTAQPGGAA